MKDTWIFLDLPGIYCAGRFERWTLDDWQEMLDAINTELNLRTSYTRFSNSAELLGEISELKYARRKLKTWLTRQKRKQA